MTLTTPQTHAIEARLSEILAEAESPERAYGEVVLVVERGRIAGIRKMTSQRMLDELLGLPP